MSGDDERKDPPLGPLEEINEPGDEEKMEPSPRLLEPIPKKERPDVLDPISRPSVSASRPQEVRFQRERRKLSETSARKTITDHSKDSEPISAAERADLSAAIARKTVNFNTNTPLVPLSMKERRELVRSISIVVREPETPSWFSEGLDDVEEEGEGKKEEEEAVDKKEVAEPSRAPEGSGDGPSGAPPDESTAPPPALRRASTRLTRVPTKRVFPTPSTKDEERLNPFSKKERRALVRSLSMAVVAPSTPVIWDRDPADASESEEGQSIDKPEFAPPPPDLDELRTKPKVQKSGKRHRTVRVHVSDLARSHAVDSLEYVYISHSSSCKQF